MAFISHMSFSISFSYREISVFWLYEFTLRLKQSGHHFADDNFQLIILVWVLLYFDKKKKSLWDREKWLQFCRWLGDAYVRIIDCPLLSLVTTVYPKKYAHGFVVLCFVVVMQSFIMNSHEVFIHIHQGCFAGTRAIVRLPQCQWSKLNGYGKIGQCITTTKHSKTKTVCIFLGIYCITVPLIGHY